MESEEYFELIQPLNLFKNEKEVKDFCQISDNIEDLQAFREACFTYGGCAFVHIIDARIEEISKK